MMILRLAIFLGVLVVDFLLKDFFWRFRHLLGDYFTVLVLFTTYYLLFLWELQACLRKGKGYLKLSRNAFIFTFLAGFGWRLTLWIGFRPWNHLDWNLFVAKIFLLDLLLCFAWGLLAWFIATGFWVSFGRIAPKHRMTGLIIGVVTISLSAVAFCIVLYHSFWMPY